MCQNHNRVQLNALEINDRVDLQVNKDLKYCKKIKMFCRGFNRSWNWYNTICIDFTKHNVSLSKFSSCPKCDYILMIDFFLSLNK
jgi:hypothetical protein